jgi:hypothetical protein
MSQTLYIKVLLWVEDNEWKLTSELKDTEPELDQEKFSKII